MGCNITIDYAERLERNFYSRTNEKEVVTSLLGRMLDGQQLAHSVDVGPGPGALTRVLFAHSKALTLFEPNESYREALLGQFPSARVEVAPIEEAELPTGLDLILLSHVLYYLPIDTWAQQCRRLVDALRPGGRLVVVLSAPAGDWWRVLDAFWDQFRADGRCHYQPPEVLARDLADLGTVDVTAYEFETRYDDVCAMATAFGEQILQIADHAILDREEENLLALAREICAANGSPVLKSRGRILVVTRG